MKFTNRLGLCLLLLNHYSAEGTRLDATALSKNQGQVQESFSNQITLNPQSSSKLGQASLNSADEDEKEEKSGKYNGKEEEAEEEGWETTIAGVIGNL